MSTAQRMRGYVSSVKGGVLVEGLQQSLGSAWCTVFVSGALRVVTPCVSALRASTLPPQESSAPSAEDPEFVSLPCTPYSRDLSQLLSTISTMAHAACGVNRQLCNSGAFR